VPRGGSYDGWETYELQNAENVVVVLDQLVAKLRLEQDVRLASVLHHQLHVAAWATRTEQFVELQRVLRHALCSNVSLHSDSTTVQIRKILAAIEQDSA
jgi:hypothetical protein